MGLLLSVLVVCVGFVELLAFLHNVRSNLVWPPVHPDLTPIDLSRLGVPSLTLNSHEDIELEYDEDITGRSRSPSPRSFLVTERKVHGDSPRRFVVSEDQLVFEETDFEVPRCAFSSQEDEEVRRCVWPAPSGKIDVILRNTGRDTTEFWTNKVLVQPPGAKPAAEALVDERYLNSLDGLDKVKVVRRRGGSGRSSKKRRGAEDDAGTSRGGFENRETVAGKSSLECHGRSEREAGEPFWLIFSGEYTKAMNKDWHGQHFCCWQCDESLTGQRYVLRDDHPYCVSCYESVFANACEKCSRTIGIDSKDLSYKDKHWHEACFLCTTCGESLVDKQFGSKGDRIYCGSCYDQQFASRCDGCHEIFRAGTKKMEYKTRQWHEKCFCCCMCKVPIGTQSFIPREQEIFCAKCYEEKFATRCIKCNKVITSGGVTYKNEPWHRECFTCTHCEKSLAGERFTSRDDKPYCAECFGELFAKRCTACSRPITGIGGTKFISFEDRHWHNDCFFCANCRTSLVGRGFITDQEDIICPECAKQKLM